MTRVFSERAFGGADAADDRRVFEQLRLDFPNSDVRQVLNILAHADAAAANDLSNLRIALLHFYAAERRLTGATRRHLTQIGQIRWSDTEVAGFQRQQATDLLALDPLIGQLSQVSRVVDLGAGDGRMTLAVLKALSLAGADVTAVDLLDQNGQALRLAEANLHRSLPGLAVTAHERDLRQITPAPREGRLAFASAALHELPHPERISFLLLLAQQFEHLMIVELAQDHNTPEQMTGELALKAAQFYDKLIADALSSLPSMGSYECAGVFLLGELLNIWSADYAHRGNYHLNADQWLELVEGTGFVIEANRVSAVGGLELVTLMARSKVISMSNL